MAFPQLFALQFKGTGNPGVYEIPAGLTPIQRGADLPGVSLIAYTTGIPNRMESSVVNFKGEIFCVYLGRVFRYVSGTSDSWEQVYFDSIQSTNLSTRYSRLLIYTDLTGDSRIGFIYNNSSGHTKYATSSTGLSGEWDQVVSFGAVGDADKIGTIVYQNKFYHIDAADRIVIIDPIAETRSTATYNGNKFWEGWFRFVVHKDRLFLWSVHFPDGEFQLEEFDGANFQPLGHITSGNTPATFGPTGKVAIWSDGTDIHIIANGQHTPTDFGSRYWKVNVDGVTDPVAAVEATSTVIPASLRNRGNVSNSYQFDRWFVYVDNNNDPLNPIYYLAVLQNADLSAIWGLYRFVDDTTELTSEGGWAAADFSPPHLLHGGNELLVVEPETAYATIVSSVGVLGGLQIGYRVHGTLATDPVTIKLYYDDTQGASPMTQAALTGAVTGGGTKNGDQVDDVIPDDGATLHTLIWNFFDDGVANGAQVRVMLDAI
jgi:hypothetical protein